MKQGASRSFASRLSALAATTSVLAVVMVTGTLRVVELLDVKPTALGDATYMARTMAVNGAPDLAADDKTSVQRITSYASSNPNIVGAYIYQGPRLYARYHRPGDAFDPPGGPPPVGYFIEGRRLRLSEPLIHAGRPVGTLLVVYDMRPLYAQVQRNLVLSLLIGASAVLVALLLARRMQQSLARPIAELASTAQLVSGTQNYGLRATRRTDDELGRLTDDFNLMLQRIQQREEELNSVQGALAYSEERSRKIVDTALDAVVTMDSYGKITGWNTQAERTFGWPFTAAVGRLLHEVIIPTRYREAHLRGLRRYHETGQGPVLNQRIEISALHADGTEFPVELAITPIRVEGALHFSGFIRDITERKRAVEALAREQALMRTLTDNIPDSIYIKDSACRFLMNNPAHLKALGASAQEEVLGKTDFDFFPRDLAERYHADDLRVVREGSSLLHLEEPVVEAGGGKRWMAVSKVPIRDGSGAVTGLIGISRDITDLREALDRLGSANTELVQKNQEMEQFVYTVSHDLKSPIVTCLGFLGLMREDMKAGQTEAMIDSMNRLERAATRMRQSIDDLLELSRIGRIRHEPEAIDMDELIAQITDELGPRLSDAGVELQVQPGLPTVAADRVRVTEVFENLLTNAMKYGATGRPPRIEVGAEPHDGEDRFFVRDNGAGIDRRYHQKVFALFQRLDTKKEGTGVGLTIVHRIMEVHGGRAWVESEVGKGATFWVAFPRQPGKA